MTTLSAIAAVAENYVIGRDGDLPWRLPADLKWFVEKTRAKPLIFGRKTFESTGYLKGRRNIVVTRQPDYESDCDLVVNSVDAALAATAQDEEVMVLGGAAIYELLMPRVDRFYLTVIHARPDGDTHFPPIDARQWRISFEEHRSADAKNSHDMTFFILERVQYGPVVPLLPARLRGSAQ